ncbi:hypothetical protein [Gulosibacter bifidus]|uniref:Glycosyl transferase n=1 Tax=Gulosibacter bifidus TaxID=272239 RepID=A0ABW5RI38_9MICO|nr:hypothetical protein [Gulosibacter bifidus]
MRFILAAIATIASLAMLTIGGIQLVHASQETTVTAKGTSQSDAPLVVVDDTVLSSRAGSQLVEIEGDGKITLVIGRTADVDAWVGDAKHTEVALDESAKVEDGTLPLKFTESGTEAEVPNPVTSDLWFERHEGEGKFRLDTVVAPGYSMLIAADGKAAAPATISVTWPAAGYAPMSGPLLVAGGVVLLLAIGLWIWAIAHRRRLAATASGARDDSPRKLRSRSAVAQASNAESTWSAVPWDDSVTATDDAVVREDAATGETVSETGAMDAAGAGASDADFAQDSDDVTEADEAEVETVAEPDASEKADAEVAPEFAPEAIAADDGATPEDAVANADEEIESILNEHDHDVASPFAPGAATTDVEPADTDAPAFEVEQPIADEASATEPAGDAAVEDDPAVVEPESDTPVAAPVEAQPEPVAADAEPAASEPAASAPASSEPTPDDAADDEDKWRRPRGRNRSRAPKRVFFASAVVISSLGLAGCAPQYWPANWTNTDIDPAGTPTSSVDAAILEEGAHPPALNEDQIQHVLDEAAAIAADADKAVDASKLKPRFTGDALTLREAQYKAHKANKDHPMPIEFPVGQVVYALPESGESWPRTVFAVVTPEAKDGTESAPYAIMLTQQDPRANYKVASLTQMVADAKLPDAAPASIGSPSITELAEPLVIEPDAIAAAYADVIANGDKSAHAATFEAAGDSLRESVNEAYRKKESDAIDPAVAKMTFNYSATDTKPIGMVGLNGGAIVSVSIREVESLKAANDRARIKLSGMTADFSGVGETGTGFERTYTDQLLFYVPAKSEGGKVQFLGVSQAMTSARELKAEEVG